MSCNTASHCVAVGQSLDRLNNKSPRVLSWGGAGWALGTVARDPNAQLLQIKGVSRSGPVCTIVGSSLGYSSLTRSTVIETGSASFTDSSIDHVGELNAVSGVDKGDCVAVGHQQDRDDPSVQAGALVLTETNGAWAESVTTAPAART